MDVRALDAVPPNSLGSGWTRGLGVEEVPGAVAARAHACRSRGGRLLGAFAGEELAGVVAMRENAWDAERLGVASVVAVEVFEAADAPSAEALADAVVGFARERRSALAYLRVDAAAYPALNALLARGFAVVETLLALAAPVAALPLGEARAAIRPARGEDLPALRALAARAFPDSRFNDPRGPRDWSARVYSAWIDARFAQAGPDLLLLVAEHEGAPAGFVTWKVHETPGTSGLTGQVDLVAVEPRARGRGLGRALFDEARRRSPPLAWVAADVYARNRDGLRLHHGYGLRAGQTVLYLHRWSHPTPGAT